MASGDSLLSPESTVTSLLASSGRLRSSLNPEPALTIKYRNRPYESATEALDAYIADFLRNDRRSDASVGELELPKEHDTSDLCYHGYRSRDVLKDSLTDRELDLLLLPAGRPRRASDHHSVTTDDLLLLPCDGSLPVTHTSAALSCSADHSLRCSVKASSRSRSRPGGVVKKPLYCRAAALCPPCGTLPSSRGSLLCVDDLLAGSRISQQETPFPSAPLTSQWGAPLPRTELASQACHHLPRWITSHKSEMDFSGVTSIPDLRYPAWLKQCHVPTEALDGDPFVPSWVSDLERNTVYGRQELKDHEKVKGQIGNEQAMLRELRLQFAETLAAAERGSGVRDKPQEPFRGLRDKPQEPFRGLRDKPQEPFRGLRDKPQEPFRDDRIGFLIHRAERVLNSSSLGISSSTHETNPNPSPGSTEDLLESQRSWDNPPVTFKSPVPVGGAEDHPTTEESEEGTTEKSTGSCSSGGSSRKHPGPVEALKQMLFSLQAVEQRVTQQEDTSQPAETPNPPARAGHRGTGEVPQADIEDGPAPGGQSLERALHHLGRLKSLVDEMSEKKLQQDV